MLPNKAIYDPEERMEGISVPTYFFEWNGIIIEIDAVVCWMQMLHHGVVWMEWARMFMVSFTILAMFGFF